MDCRRFAGFMLAVFGLGAALPAAAWQSAQVSISRLDCGTAQVNQPRIFSDSGYYDASPARAIVVSCYLIRHGDDYLLWDAGLPAAMLGAPLSDEGIFSGTLRETMVSQLARAGVRPEDITKVGVSHYHIDHIGQASDFPNATLLIGNGDYKGLLSDPKPPMVEAGPVMPWVTGERPVDPVVGDRDVFGDGSVIMLAMPGHTPGHSGLLVNLKGAGAILLSGDLAHFHEMYDRGEVLTLSSDRADVLASLDRMKKLAVNRKATVIVTHDPDDLGKIAAFPEFTR